MGNYTIFPKSRAAMLKFSACKVGDIVWFVGGHEIGINWQSYGRRAKVSKIATSGQDAGIVIIPDDSPKERHLVRALITRNDILKMLEEDPQRRDEILGRFQLKPEDLDGHKSGNVELSREDHLKKLSKAQLIERVIELENQLTQNVV